ncbi:glycosyl transferase family 2 [Sphingobacteriales bacterium UPWRP_1]|nr:glycosyl transferase family 2 [Sphingobacteriales bacterium TSM_CSM]PSJ74184.1 glycosyl transferase family 2 [Sphingobacteriales bacterium UPWRP_1]
MVKLSVIIVNYNVKYFLEQALLSVRKAAEGLAAEVIVVDNNSVDGSVELIGQKFPEVILIANTQNTGFSAANNQGIGIAKGEYVLLLNPDTVVEEDTFRKTIGFMDEHPDAGALGVKMYDGKGVFLPESKRGLPTPATAFYKMSGLSALFPHSKTFNHYYLGHLNNNEVHEIEVLSGAFMLLRKKVLDEIGLLDETFFMYGEDIDLSYRIIKAGYKNYYYPHTRIIHYKGESTKKGSLNYVRMFYNAMIIFARKHFTAEKARVYVTGIQTAIYLRALLAVLERFVVQALLPLSDAAIIYGGMYLIKDFWQHNVKAAEGTTYAPEYMLINVPLYIAIWLFTVFLSGGYDAPLRLSRIVRGLVAGTVLISAVYGFLPETMRFSRGMILMGTAWAVFALSGWRMLLHFLKFKNLNLEAPAAAKRAVIVGSLPECVRVRALLYDAGVNIDITGYVLPEAAHTAANATAAHATSAHVLGYTAQLHEIATIYKVNEIIFCAKDLPSQQILQFMIDIGQLPDYKIVPPESLSIIGSNSKNTAGDLYTIDINLNLNQPRYRRNKRLLDLCLCLLLLLAAPLALLLIPHRKQLLLNWLQVLLNQKTWVGYVPEPAAAAAANTLPKLQPAVLYPTDELPHKPYDAPTLQRLNLLYAKNYHPYADLDIVWQGWKWLGRG